MVVIHPAPSTVLRTILVLLALTVLAATLHGCPKLPPVSGCAPGAQRCSADAPEVCSATQRWHPAGDVACSAVGGACVVRAGVAVCARAQDGGAR